MDIQKVTKLEELVNSFRAKYNEITEGEKENVGVVLSLQVDCEDDNKNHTTIFVSGTPGDQVLAVKKLDDETHVVEAYAKYMALRSLKRFADDLLGDDDKKSPSGSPSDEHTNEEQGE